MRTSKLLWRKDAINESKLKHESHAASSYEPDAARVLSYELAACNTLGSTKPLAVQRSK